MVAAEEVYCRLNDGNSIGDAPESDDKRPEQQNRKRKSFSKRLRGVGRKVIKLSLPKAFRKGKSLVPPELTPVEKGVDNEGKTVDEAERVVERFTVEIENDKCPGDLVRSLSFASQHRLEEFVMHDYDRCDNSNIEVVKESNEHCNDAHSNTTDESLTDDSSTEDSAVQEAQSVLHNYVRRQIYSEHSIEASVSLHNLEGSEKEMIGQDIEVEVSTAEDDCLVLQDASTPARQAAANATAFHAKTYVAEQDNEVGCLYDPNTPLWGHLTCGAIGRLSSLNVKGPPTVLEPRSRDDPLPSLAWLGSPVDTEDEEGYSIVEKEQNITLKLPLDSPLLSFSYSETPSLALVSDPEVEPKVVTEAHLGQSESAELNSDELAKRQKFQEHLRLSSIRLMQEQEETKDMGTDQMSADTGSNESTKGVIYLKHIPLKKQRAAVTTVVDAMSKKEKEPTKDYHSLYTTPSREHESTGKEEVNETKADDACPDAQVKAPKKEDSSEHPLSSCCDRDAEARDDPIWKAGFSLDGIEDFQFDVTFPDAVPEFEVASQPEGGATTQGEEALDVDPISQEEVSQSGSAAVDNESAMIESQLVGEKILDDQTSEGPSNADDEDSVLVERIIRELEELEVEDPRRSQKIAEAKRNPPPPPPLPHRPQPTMSPVVYLDSIRSQSPESICDRYAVEEEASLKEGTVTSVTVGPIPLMRTEFATLIGSHNDIQTAGTAKSTRRGRDPPARTAFVAHDAGEETVTLRNLPKPITPRGILRTGSSFTSSARSSEDQSRCCSIDRGQDYNNGRSKHFSSTQDTSLPEEDSIFAGMEDYASLAHKSGPKMQGVISLGDVLEESAPNQDSYLPCEEIFVEKAITRTMADNTNIRPKKKVTFVNDDIISLASMSTQGLSIATYNKDIFYGCVREDAVVNVVTHAILKEVDKYIDEYVPLLASGSGDESSVESGMS